MVGKERVTSEDLSENLRQFIQGCLDSVEQLRVLLLLYSQPDRTWTTAEITAEMRSVESSIGKRLEGLYTRRVLNRATGTGTHQFLPARPEITALVRELADENQLRPYRVIDAIYARPSQSIQDLADAFKLRGDK